MALSIVSLNVNGVREPSKREGLLQWLRSLSVVVDVVCLQEAHCVSDVECHSWFSSSGFNFVLSPGTCRSGGCIVLYRPVLQLDNFKCDFPGRSLLCEFTFYGASFRVLCLYAPNRNPARDNFFNGISDAVNPAFPTVLCGDFNTVFDRSLDRFGSCVDETSRESTAALNRLFDSCCVVDIWRYLHPTASSFTWNRWDGQLASRIDLVGCPYPWIASVSACDIIPFPFSDHCALLFSFSIPDVIPPGPGLWKLNISILQEMDYVKLITDFWFGWQRSQNNFPSLSDWWELGKQKIKDLTIGYCTKKAKERRAERALLSRLADHLKFHVDLGRMSCLGPYQSTLAELGRFDLEAARGAQVRSRVRWVEEGEKSSAYFFRLEKKRSADRRISALRESDGTIISGVDDLCRSISAFYSDLFSSAPTDAAACESLLGNICSTLTPEQASSCEGPLSVEECFSALSGMAKRKAPGSDGLPMEFFVKFWDVLGGDLVCVLNSCYRDGVLSLSQRSGVISLSFKKGDRLDIRNWRPISLLNVDYKLASRVIAGRLLKVIHLVVEKDQTCGVPGRFIGENVALLRDVAEYATLTNAPVAILSLDQEKAFDRVEWAFMRQTLQAMGFGESFIGWVDLFYHHVCSVVNVNGYLSEPFFLSRGVRQGCPLSPLLYVLVSEVLAVSIRANPRIRGLSLPGASAPLSPISQYADDTSIIVTTDDAISATFETYSIFERGSGSKLNLSKSKGLWLGSWSGRQDPPVNLDWCSTKIKVLGVFIGVGDLEELNWRPRITAVENVLSSWRQRRLSFCGRALVINALALSRIWYVAALVHMPEWVVKELNTLVFNFFWKGKRDLVSRSVVVQPSLFGGFSVVSVKFKVWSLIAQWVKRFASSPASWTAFMSYWFSCCFGVTPTDVFSRPWDFDPKLLPCFYESLVLAWRSLDGSFSVVRASLVMGSSSPHSLTLVEGMTTKSCYQYLLSENLRSPHCVDKFLPSFGALYWSTTWKELQFFDTDRYVIDLSWKIAHGVLYTAARLASFGYDFNTSCFCGPASETLEHLFFHCPLAHSVLSWLQSLMFIASPLAPSLLCRHALFGFDADELLVVPRIFVYILNVCKFFIWHARNDFRFRSVRPGALTVIENVKTRVRFHLPIHFKRFQSSRRRRFFHRQWGGRGAVASVVSNRLVLHL